MKFAFVSHVLPASWSGQAMMIYRLLRGFDPNDYCLISRQNFDPGNYKNSHCDKLPARYYPLSAEFRITSEGLSPLEKWGRRLNLLRVVVLARRIAAIVTREDCGAVIACAGALLDPPTGYLTSRLAGRFWCMRHQIPCRLGIAANIVAAWSWMRVIQRGWPGLSNGSQAAQACDGHQERAWNRRRSDLSMSTAQSGFLELTNLDAPSHA
jgi:hypothetical protein